MQLTRQSRLIKFKTTIALMLISFLVSQYSMADSKKIVLAADNWCPYNCNADDADQGYIVEIAQTVFGMAGYSIEYLNMPWSRAIYSVENGSIDGIIGAGLAEVPSLVFPQQPAGISSHVIFTKPSNPWQYKFLKSLEQLRLGVIQDYSYGNLYRDYIQFREGTAFIEKVASDNALESLLKMISLNRIDALVEDRNVLNFTLKKSSPQLVLVERAVISNEKIYIAFTPKSERSQKLSDIYDKNLLKIRKSGKLAEILKKYNIRDWD